MRAVSFGRINVQNHGVLVKMGQSTLSGNIVAADESFSVTSATPFCQDMCPFKLDIDPAGTLETVMVKSITGGTTFNVQRGIDGTKAADHVATKSVFANFTFAGWRLSNVAGLTGKMYWGTKNLVAAAAGVIKEFCVPVASATAGGVDDHFEFMSSSQEGNPLKLIDFAMDAAVDGEGLYVTLWER